MLTPRELRALIRHSLSSLRARNGHHEFEELCRELTKAKLCDRVIPATGPVAGLGDQGRDFETYRTYLTECRDEPTFLGAGPEDVIVFACTLQVDRVEEKIEADIASITSHPHLPASAIVVFTEVDLPIGRRNRVRENAKRDHGTDVQILDGAAIADLLASGDTAWIATRFLDIPARYIPEARPDPDDTEYLERRARWAGRDPQLSWGDLEDIKRCLRYVYSESRFEEDLEWWLRLLDPFVDHESDGSIRRAAVYERAIARLRGLGDLRASLDELAWYYETIDEVLSSSQLDDAQILVSFCYGAATVFDAGLEQTTVDEWCERLREHLDREIEETDNPARLFSLHISRGALALYDLAEATFEPIHRHWAIALEHAKDASLHSISTLADRCTPMSPAFANDAKFRRFIAQVEVILAEQEGAGAVAQRAHARGMACVEADQALAALREFHLARDGWQAAHDIDEVLGTLGQIATCYRHLGLHYAAKYYFLVCALLATNSSPSDGWYVAKGLLEAAWCEYELGHWDRFLRLAGLGIKAHAIFDESAGDMDEYEVLSRIMHAAGLVYLVSVHHVPSKAPEARALADTLFPTEMLDEFRDEPPSWLVDAKHVAETFRDQIGVRPFDDLDEHPVVAWKALGVHWRIHTPEQAGLSVEAERLAVTLQILQADLADFDLCTLPMDANVLLTVGDTFHANAAEDGDWTFEAQIQASDSEADHAEMERFAAETLAISMEMFGMTSVLAYEEAMDALESRFDEGLASKLTTFRLYDDVVRPWLTDPDSTTGGPFGPPVEPSDAHPDLRWPDGPGPKYSRNDAIKSLENRYAHFAAATKYTRIRLRASPEVLATIEKLRSDGWLDWHILGAIHGVALSYRANLGGPPQSAEELRARIVDPFAPETPDAVPVPAREFTEEMMRRTHEAGATSALVSTWGHTLNVRRVRPGPIMEFLRVRYRHYDDDIEHDPIFQT